MNAMTRDSFSAIVRAKEGRKMSQKSPWMRVFSIPKLQKEIVRLEGELARAQQRVKQLEQGKANGDDNA
jgi:hypothetical protein